MVDNFKIPKSRLAQQIVHQPAQYVPYQSQTITQPLQQITNLNNPVIQFEKQQSSNTENYQKEIDQIKKRQKELIQELESTSTKKKYSVQQHVYHQPQQVSTSKIEKKTQKQIQAPPAQTQTQVLNLKMEDQTVMIKKLMKKLTQSEKNFHQEKSKHQEFEYKFNQLKIQYDLKIETLESVSRDLRKLEEKYSQSLVETEKYKVLAQFLEEENERLRNLGQPPTQEEQQLQIQQQEPVEKIIEVPVERFVEIPIERRVEVPVERIIEVPVEVIREVEVFVEQNPEEKQYLINELNRLQDDIMVLRDQIHYKDKDIEMWREKFMYMESNYMDRADNDMGNLNRDNTVITNELNKAYAQIDDYRNRIELLYKEIEDITKENQIKNEDLERNIRHLQQLLTLSNVTH